MNTLAIVHVFYPAFWPELARCLRNIPEMRDLVVTYVDDAAIAEARRDFPNARFIRCSNRGFDVWPFLCALRSVDLSNYDLVVKLHTKRDIVLDYDFIMGRTRLNGDAWRQHLLSFVATPEAWNATLRQFDDPSVGMVGDLNLVFGRREAGKGIHDRAAREVRERMHLPAKRSGVFVAGTMFAARAAALRPFAEGPFSEDLFTESPKRDSVTYAHVMERMFGLAIGAQGLKVVAFNGSVARRRLVTAICKFVFNNRRSERRHSIRIFGITVYRRRLKDDTAAQSK